MEGETMGVQTTKDNAAGPIVRRSMAVQLKRMAGCVLCFVVGLCPVICPGVVWGSLTSQNHHQAGSKIWDRSKCSK